MTDDIDPMGNIEYPMGISENNVIYLRVERKIKISWLKTASE